MHHFLQWQQPGATLLNPAQFILDSKTSLAALQLPKLRQRIAEKHSMALAILDRCLPETSLLTPDRASFILADKDDWVVKFAGYDRGQQAGGAQLANRCTTYASKLADNHTRVSRLWLACACPTDGAFRAG